MKVIAISEFGGTEKFFEAERDTPRPRADEVLIRIRAGSFNPIDYKIRQGRYGGDLPMVLGHDAAGVVEEVGSSVGRAAGWRRSLGLSRRAVQQRRKRRVCCRAARIRHGPA